MKVKVIDFGGKIPERNHYNDAGADVFTNAAITIPSHSIVKIPLGFGLEIPDGYVGFIMPRSGMSTKEQLTTEVVPIDSGYRGEIHAIVYNASPYEKIVIRRTKIAQLVIVPVIIANFMTDEKEERGEKGFGSSDKYNDPTKSNSNKMNMIDSTTSPF